ncbi:MAG: hypothetical protein IPK26_08445 [Planctomycetes bacterium]|nr:hypothetical protein [Planctomycetota bacterium]
MVIARAFAGLTSCLLASLPAQREEDHLPLLPANEAFAAAQKDHKRVLVYQDWPG